MVDENELNGGKPREHFLPALFLELEASGYLYCVLRNYEQLPQSLAGSDLDMIVLPAQRDQVAALVIDIASQFGGRLISEYTTTGRYMKFLGYHAGEWWGAAIDLMPGLDYQGVIYLSAPFIIERSCFHGRIKVTSTVDVDLMALIKELLNNGKTRESYLPDAVEAYQRHGAPVMEVAAEAFGQETTQKLADWMLTDESSRASSSSMAELMRQGVQQTHGRGQWETKWMNLWRKIQRVGSPPGMVLAITGTDGAGKTTVIERISPVLNVALHGGVQYQHLRPNWLPVLGVATGQRNAGGADGAGAAGPVTNPHGQSASGLMGSLVRLVYYWLDYVFGYWKLIFPQIVKKSRLCLFDRYFHDVMIDPRRMRMALPRWILNTAFCLAPKPKLIICLGADPDVLYQRKPETSLAEVTRQVQALKALAQSTPNALWIDTGQSLQQTENDVLRAIQITMANRYWK